MSTSRGNVEYHRINVSHRFVKQEKVNLGSMGSHESPGDCNSLPLIFPGVRSIRSDPHN